MASSWPALGQLMASSWPAHGQLHGRRMASSRPTHGQLAANRGQLMARDLAPPLAAARVARALAQK
eukprot:2449884-Lingulodinium_polyedra.AAC.1